MRRLTVLAVACAIPGALLAQTATPAAAAEKPVKEKKICRSEQVTGSLMPLRTCHTREEWGQIDAANRRVAEQFSNDRRGSSGSAPGK